MRRRVHLAVAIIASAVSSFGCVSPFLRIAPGPPEHYEVVGEVEGRACGFNLFGFLPMNTVDRTARAYRQMTAGYEAFYETDVEMRETMSWWVVGTSLCTRLSATAHPRR